MKLFNKDNAGKVAVAAFTCALISTSAQAQMSGSMTPRPIVVNAIAPVVNNFADTVNGAISSIASFRTRKLAQWLSYNGDQMVAKKN